MATEIAGYIASSLVLLTFMTKDMRLLRMVAIVSNFAFIGYGALGWLLPVLCLHLLLLPLNVLRLCEMRWSADQRQLQPGRSGQMRFENSGTERVTV